MKWLAAILTAVLIVKSDASTSLDYRSVSYEDLLPSLEQFFDDGVVHFDELLFDSPHHQLIVGKPFFNQVISGWMGSSQVQLVDHRSTFFLAQVQLGYVVTSSTHSDHDDGSCSTWTCYH